MSWFIGSMVIGLLGRTMVSVLPLFGWAWSRLAGKRPPRAPPAAAARNARRFVGTVSIGVPLFYGNALAAPETGAAPNMRKLERRGGD
ncbi:hypothetical protein BOSE62_150078 [Bosea sp. 62]|nr:hypothetical protein BOSE21B_10992 [Bosea sp. 21B]CAD5261850.1 hypothetical protein BOSE7B_150146 [Bosea sp. 7B]CAD5272831.1 hypothetical protein BOSE46_20220 [Bosea sp. 46]VVT43526.1 hypothetical protein BOS5A_10081 [Bosea sp. EC-HK365B]VXB67128.1 hypothetical protein BOSE62_150078 [Bosea sp. 62]VXC32436.1 hypothetical protein BOSE127_180148 [Bosea sp. 127]VXC58264.1 hypothetical protein BOSE125_30219 [Bosea sp. 125]